MTPDEAEAMAIVQIPGARHLFGRALLISALVCGSVVELRGHQTGSSGPKRADRARCVKKMARAAETLSAAMGPMLLSAKTEDGPSPTFHRPNDRFSDADLRRLGTLTGLRALDLSLCEVSDSGLSLVRTAPGLRKLDLFGTRVGDDGLQILEDLPELRVLYLESTNVGDAGLAHLARLTNLETLTLSGTRVTDAGLARLQGLTRLKNLDLTCTAVTDSGMERLRRALPGTAITH